MASSDLRSERIGASREVLLVTLDRPRRANAYTAAMLDAIRALLEQERRRGTLRAAIVIGARRHFCAGADRDELAQKNESEALSLQSREVWDLWAEVPWPTVAVVNGPAVGGGAELALACDVRICAPSATFRFPELEMGLVPAAGGIRRLVVEVGVSRAKELVLFGSTLDAMTACAWGLACRVHEQPLELALELAEAIGRRDMMAVAAAKLLLVDQSNSLRGRGGEAITQALLYGRRRRGAAT